MKENDILVVECHNTLPQESLKELHADIMEQKKTGVVLLPVGCRAVIVPEGTEIRMKNQSSAILEAMVLNQVHE